MNDSELKRKLSGYKRQDLKHEIFSETFFVTKDEVVRMFDTAGGKCTYCTRKMATSYTKNDRMQWTLDRIDNRMGHNRGNVLLSCLECNLKRGNVCSAEQFRFTKQLRIVCTGISSTTGLVQPDANNGRLPDRWKIIRKLNESVELD